MKKSDFLVNVGLIFCGVFVSFILVESVLHIGEKIYLWHHHALAQKKIEQYDTLRILCLGESTTGGFRHSYPSQLQTILDREYPARSFVVINAGIPSTDSLRIAETLDEYITTYEPDIVLTMIGINDDPDFALHSRSLLKTVNLFRLLIEHLRKRNTDATPHTPTNNEAQRSEKEDHAAAGDPIRIGSVSYVEVLENGITQFREGHYSKAIESFTSALAIDPDKSAAIFYLGESYRMHQMPHKARSYYEQIPQSDQYIIGSLLGIGWCYLEEYEPTIAYTYFKEVLDRDPQNEWAYFGYGRCAEQQKEYDTAYKQYEKALMISPDNEHVRKALGRLAVIGEVPETSLAIFNYAATDGFDENNSESAAWYLYKNGKFADALELFQKEFQRNPTDHLLYYFQANCLVKLQRYQDAIAVYERLLSVPEMKERALLGLHTVYIKTGDHKRANAYRTQAQACSRSRVNPYTMKNYRRIAEDLRTAGILHCAIQYPMRDVRDLQKILADQPGVMYIDNQHSFIRAVGENGYDTLFIDNFAGDFGHCTKEGNRLLAENVARVLLKELFDHEM